MSKPFYCFLIVVLAAVPCGASSAFLLKAIGAAYDRAGADPKTQAIALRWYSLAATQGDAEAMLLVGMEFYGGVAVRQDYARAVTWWRRAAARGDSHAELMLSDAYCRGQGVAMNAAEALRWWQRAATDGNAASGEAPPHCPNRPALVLPETTWKPHDRI